MFRSLFSKKKPPLSGAPAQRRLKTYSGQTGYVYQYFYQGHRNYQAPESGLEFVFCISSDRKNWWETSVLIGDGALGGWQTAHGRELSSTERYAIAKMALFQAFDERPTPARMADEMRVRRADV